eukprot:CAMPEP_0181435610 /NCGR_PEP_ID=MMETSP1110-20121109/20421_1 /TAXON_ID=174948 /ORGANISM="Symbiodinium sp., Strain CCMP421" /LENGTH=66 /DNA_ID=CAMNT_0023559149 /DNA_START=199 /DNA_END=395 /DNA_ORIENTATION=+
MKPATTKKWCLATARLKTGLAAQTLQETSFMPLPAPIVAAHFGSLPVALFAEDAKRAGLQAASIQA